MPESDGEITQLLLAWSEGDQDAFDRLMPLVETELRQIARRHFAREGSGHTLQPTALVNELYLRLAGRRRVRWSNRAHFLGFAAQTMRRILVDHARVRNAEKRGQGQRNLSLEEVDEVSASREVDLVALDDALRSLAEIDPGQSRIVELRYFGGLTHDEVAEVLGISPRTAYREWRTARLWLRQAISGETPGSGA